MEDILYNAAMKYKKLLKKEYHIVLGRKGKTYKLQLRFTMDSFFHLIGLQHLTDITYSSTNKERIFKDILNKKLELDIIRKSNFFDIYYIEERIVYLERLEEMIESSQISFMINHKEFIKYTTIYADYLFQYCIPEDRDSCLYFFCVKESRVTIENEYRGCSFFKKHEIDYTRGTSEAKLLYSKKIVEMDSGDVSETELFKHKNYVEDI